MVFIFEDNFESKLSKFFLSGFSENERRHIQFVNGNFNLIKGENGLKNTDSSITNSTIVVFLDLSPGNSSVINLYTDLLDYKTVNNNRIYILPIICMEYYLLSMFYDIGMYRTDIPMPTNLLSVTKAFLANVSGFPPTTYEDRCKICNRKYTVGCFSSDKNIKYEMFLSETYESPNFCFSTYGHQCPPIQERWNLFVQKMPYYPTIYKKQIIMKQ